MGNSIRLEPWQIQLIMNGKCPLMVLDSLSEDGDYTIMNITDTSNNSYTGRVLFDKSEDTIKTLHNVHFKKQ